MSMKRVAALVCGPVSTSACRWSGGALLALMLLTGSGSAAVQSPTGGGDAGKAIPLVPHRAVYDLSLLESHGARALAGVSGRIAYEFSGDACTGYSLEFRQLAILERPEGKPEQIDIRSATHEDADGASFRFRQDTSRADGAGERVQGVARRTGKGDDAGVSINLVKPARRNFSVPGAIAFPSGHLQRIIKAAQAQETTLDIKLYDAAEDGARVFDTFVVIGKRAPASPERSMEEVARKAGLDKVDRWPVSVSYYTPGSGERTPIYAISFDLYENGVSGSLRMNYGDFAIRGALRTLEQRGTGACADGGQGKQN